MKNVLAQLLSKLGITTYIIRFFAKLYFKFKSKVKYKELDCHLFATDPEGTSICKNFIDKQEYDLQIIIPMYNVQDYICDCIKSVLQATKYNVLICIINDGSKDKSRELIKQYETVPNVLIIDQENRGFSGARNRGLEHIYGKYIMFVDSDDKLNDGAINALMDEAITKKIDIVQGGYHTFIGNKTIKRSIPKNIYGMPWGKVYKAELFQDVKFPENYWFEDSIISWIVAPKANKISIINNIVYKYRKNFNGITITSKGKYKNVDTLYITECLLKDLVKTTGINQCVLETFLKQTILNYKRIHSIGNKDLDYTIYKRNISLYVKYFGDSKLTTNKTNLKLLQLAYIKDNYKVYRLIGTLMY